MAESGELGPLLLGLHLTLLALLRQQHRHIHRNRLGCSRRYRNVFTEESFTSCHLHKAHGEFGYARTHPELHSGRGSLDNQPYAAAHELGTSKVASINLSSAGHSTVKCGNTFWHADLGCVRHHGLWNVLISIVLRGCSGVTSSQVQLQNHDNGVRNDEKLLWQSEYSKLQKW